jgi:ribosomal-protein-alanine N-acetyltransferase
MTSWLAQPLDTDRLWLRPTRPGDEEWIRPLFTDPEGRMYVGGAMSEEAAQAKIQIKGPPWWRYFAIVDRESANGIGSLSFKQKNGQWEISYQLRRDFWGLGLATEAITEGLRWFFSTTEQGEVSAVTQVDNVRSCRLLERLGFDSTEEFTYRDEVVRRYVINRP